MKVPKLKFLQGNLCKMRNIHLCIHSLQSCIHMNKVLIDGRAEQVFTIKRQDQQASSDKILLIANVCSSTYLCKTECHETD